MPEITYIRATINDLEVLVDLRIEFLEEFWGKQAIEDVNNLRGNLIAHYAKVISEDTYISYLAKTADNKVVGIGGMILREQAGNFKNPSGRVGYIMNMYTIPSFRRKGICSDILNLLIAEGKEKEIGLFELHATPEGEQVYPKHGFYFHPEPTFRKYLAN